ncbi:DNA polymerase IV [Shewanella avicenniae]|uniref:DNA polymerase IV n=1 Tax=Shewanella avicenniae TaxID=2814294 RepID=A0ABX7QT51_9GAMM|nr:DNA polymerase IV [Shewanella avicenniae]QSX34652.1 DNA polymerase IV [Shewanella avicenniae]
MRKIIHIDMDCYFAAVEMRDFPELRDKPIAVGGARERRGVIATCNYQARKFGVRSAMATAYALKLCPELQLVVGRMSVYKAVSEQIHDIFRRYTPLIEPLSLDEAYLDVSNCSLHQGSATRIAEAIRQDIFNETQLTASAGVAPIKFLAKVASDVNKPNGLFVITPQLMPEFITSLPLQRIPGVGKVTAERLAQQGWHTCGDLQRVPKAQLLQLMGKFGAVLYERVRAIDDRPINPSRIRKSVGVETTFAEDLQDAPAALQQLPALLQELVKRFEKHRSERQINKLVVKVKFADFQQTTIETRSQQIDAGLAAELLAQAIERGAGKAIRLLGVSVGLAPLLLETEDSPEQLTLL